MRILTDEDLKLLVEDATAPLILPVPGPQDWFVKDSPIQPSSIDLHVGQIFIPGGEQDASGNPIPTKDRFVLESGRTVVIETFETICLPSKLAGFGFPPSRISVQGILMTNPGHLDPGYKGKLHLTAINMGSEPFEIRRDDLIVTIVIFELAKEPEADFKKRYGHLSPSSVSQTQLNRLCPDFANIEVRAQKIADRAVEKADLSIKKAKYRAAVIGTIVTAVLTVLGLWWNNQSKLDLLNHDYVNLEQRVDQKLATNQQLEDIQNQVEQLRNQVSDLKRDTKRK